MIMSLLTVEIEFRRPNDDWLNEIGIFLFLGKVRENRNENVILRSDPLKTKLKNKKKRFVSKPEKKNYHAELTFKIKLFWLQVDQK